jgi:hypothetical protein
MQVYSSNTASDIQFTLSKKAVLQWGMTLHKFPEERDLLKQLFPGWMQVNSLFHDSFLPSMFTALMQYPRTCTGFGSRKSVWGAQLSNTT